VWRVSKNSGGCGLAFLTNTRHTFIILHFPSQSQTNITTAHNTFHQEMNSHMYQNCISKSAFLKSEEILIQIDAYFQTGRK
jgi:hypothetical protein